VLLAIDVGNTETKLACFDTGSNDVRHYWRVTTDSRRTADEYGVFFTQLFAASHVPVTEITGIVIASVVPRLDHALAEVSQKFFGVSAHFLHAQDQTLIRVQTTHPAESGADLIAGAIGARERYGTPSIVVSYGTASAFVAISPDGEFMGAAIAPGINISIDALIGRTAKLPQIALNAPQHVIGRNTVEALQAGFIYGFVGQTEGIVKRMREELHADATVIATGGLADVVALHSTIIDHVDPYLSLNGLRLFYQSLRSPQSK
jgi:type III pantothenate kinase